MGNNAAARRGGETGWLLVTGLALTLYCSGSAQGAHRRTGDTSVPEAPVPPLLKSVPLCMWVTGEKVQTCISPARGQ